MAVLTLPTNLAANDIIDEAWVDAVTLAVAAMPAGLVAPPVLAGIDQTGITAQADLTSLACTCNIVAGRWYKACWQVAFLQNTTGGNQVLYVYLDTNGHIVSNRNPVAAGAVETLNGHMIFSGGSAIGSIPFVAAGSKVIKLRASTSGGTLTIGGATYNNSRFWVEDLGATSATRYLT